MKRCKYCNEIMMSEYETKGDTSYFEFHTCTRCHAVYECITKIKGKGRGKHEVHENERWWDPNTNSWEE